MLDKKELDQLYKDCMEYWGFEAQSKVAQEECAELILALFHLDRKREGAKENVIEECADVYLMINQLMYYFGKEEVMKIVDFKSNRVKARLERYKQMDDGEAYSETCFLDGC